MRLLSDRSCRLDKVVPAHTRTFFNVVFLALNESGDPSDAIAVAAGAGRLIR